MNLQDFIKEHDPHILVEGPEWGDAEFYGNWLLAAAKAEALWKEAINDPSFEKQVDRLTTIFMPDFGIGATDILSRLKPNLISCAIRVNGGEEVELVEEFAMMVEMGFFVLAGHRYQIAIPGQLNMDVVKRAALKIAQTGGEEYHLHPEYLRIATVPYAKAKAWQDGLRLLLLYKPLRKPNGDVA